MNAWHNFQAPTQAESKLHETATNTPRKSSQASSVPHPLHFAACCLGGCVGRTVTLEYVQFTVKAFHSVTPRSLLIVIAQKVLLDSVRVPMAPPLRLLFLLCQLHAVLAFVLPSNVQVPLSDQDDTFPAEDSSTPQRIAIIGSGITGSVAAYNLYESFRLKPGPQPEITVFERNAIFGGRITQAYALDNPNWPVDTCAATFSLQDTCISQSLNDVGLQPQLFQEMSTGVGLWDGKEIVGFVEANGFRNPAQWTFFRQLKWFERYGQAPQRSSTSAQQARLGFSQILSPGVAGRAMAGQRNLSQQVEASALIDVVKNDLCTAGQGSDNRVSLDCFEEKDNLFLTEVWNAGVRERYFEDVGELPALDALFAYEAEMPITVQGGNLRLIERLLLLSRAEVLLGTEVLDLTQAKKGGWDIAYTNAPAPANAGWTEEHFDTVILASSLDLANVTISPPLTAQPGLTQKYDNSFVTHFTTSSLLNSSFFGCESNIRPQNILTSPTRTDTKPPFFSLTFLQALAQTPGSPNQPGQPAEIVRLYKLASRQLISDEEIGRYLENVSDDPTKPVVTWIDRQPLPKSVPKADFKRGLVENLEIAPGLWYAGGGEQVAATAEFGCRMGRNAANLVSFRKPTQ